MILFDLPQSPECVVGVHDGVDDEVHDDKPPGGGGVLAERVPAVDQHGDVVIPVKEYQLLLSQYYEYGVSKFGYLNRFNDLLESLLINHPNLWQDKHPCPEATNSIILYEAWYTERVVEAVGVEGVHELRQGPGGAHDAEHGQEHAPSSQRSTEVKCRSMQRHL